MNINEIIRRKTEMRLKAIEAAESRSEQLRNEIPELAEIDTILNSTSVKIMSTAVDKDLDINKRMKKIKAENKKLLLKRASVLEKHGYSSDYDSPKYECNLCSDSGYIGLKLCDCVKKLFNCERYTGTGLGKALQENTFENFSLKYYSNKGRDDLSAREIMEKILTNCKKYTADFNHESDNILMIGGTGLGKTHLSAAIANKVLLKGFYVLYDSAQNVFDLYEAVRYGKEKRENIKKYENCDLLIIDDLGAECMTHYTVAVFSSLLNWRILNKKPTIISTNLTPPQIKKSYSERIYSRLMGEFRIMHFSGQDVRLVKLSEK